MASAAWKAMRRAAADRGGPALVPSPKIRRRNPYSRYVEMEYRARTLDELRERCGEHGEAAVTEAKLYALMAWSMHGNGTARSSAIGMYWDHERARLGLPKFGEEPWQSNLTDMSSEDRAAIETEVYRGLAEWEAARSPGLLSSIERTQHRIHGALVTIEERRVARDPLSQAPNEGQPQWA